MFSPMAAGFSGHWESQCLRPALARMPSLPSPWARRAPRLVDARQPNPVSRHSSRGSESTSQGYSGPPHGDSSGAGGSGCRGARQGESGNDPPPDRCPIRPASTPVPGFSRASFPPSPLAFFLLGAGQLPSTSQGSATGQCPAERNAKHQGGANEHRSDSAQQPRHAAGADCL